MSLTMTTRRALLGCLSMAALGVAALPARAQDVQVAVTAARTTPYLNGGVGQDEEQHMRQVAKDWPLRITFSERKDNEFAADIDLLIRDAKGKPVLQLAHAGPMTYAKLPAGSYRVSARLHGQLETREVTLDGKTGHDLFFHWKGDAKG